MTGRQALFVNADPTDQGPSSNRTGKDEGLGVAVVRFQTVITLFHIFDPGVPT